MQTINLDKLPPQAQLELVDFYESLLRKYTTGEVLQTEGKLDDRKPSAEQPQLGDLALTLFGNAAGVNLELPQHLPHEPIEF